MVHTALRRAAFVTLLFVCASTGRADDRTVLPVPIHTFGGASAWVVAVEADTFPLTLLAEVDFSYYPGMAFGDTDHDGANELAFTGGSNSYRIWEHQGGNVYSLVATGTSDFLTYAMGDVDRDGRSEIIGQTSGYVQVHESVDASSHPSQLAWSSPYLSNVGGYTTVGDTDRDGRMEIIHSVNGIGPSSRLVIF